MNIDNTVYYALLEMLKSGKMKRNGKTASKEILEGELLFFPPTRKDGKKNYNLAQQFRRGKSPAKGAPPTTYWPNDSWRNVHLPEKYAHLDTPEMLEPQEFPDEGNPKVLTLESHLYNVFLKFLNEYKAKEETTDERTKEYVRDVLKSFYIPEKYRHKVMEQESLQALAHFIVEETRKGSVDKSRTQLSIKEEKDAEENAQSDDVQIPLEDTDIDTHVDDNAESEFVEDSLEEDAPTNADSETSIDTVSDTNISIDDSDEEESMTDDTSESEKVEPVETPDEDNTFTVEAIEMSKTVKELLVELLDDPNYAKDMQNSVVKACQDGGYEPEEFFELLLSIEPTELHTIILDYDLRVPASEDSGENTHREVVMLELDHVNRVNYIPPWDNISLREKPERGKIPFKHLCDADVDYFLTFSPELPVAMDYDYSLYNVVLGSRYLVQCDFILMKELLAKTVSVFLYAGDSGQSPDERLLGLGHDKSIPDDDSPYARSFRRALLFSRISFYQQIMAAQEQKVRTIEERALERIERILISPLLPIEDEVSTDAGTPPVDEELVSLDNTEQGDAQAELENEQGDDSEVTILEEDSKLKAFFGKVTSFLKENHRDAILVALALLISLSMVIAGTIHRKKPLVYDPALHYAIELTAPSDMSISDFNTSVKAIEERLKILAGREKYRIEKTEDSLKLIMPKTLFQGQEPENVMSAMIAHPSELCLLNLDSFSFFEFTPECYAKIERSDIASIDVCTDSIPTEYEIDSETSYIKLVVTDTWAAENSHTEAWTNFVVAQDVTSDVIHNADTIRRGATFYLLGIDFPELAVHNYTTQPLAGEFYIEVQHDVTWDKVNDSSFPGKNQVDFSQLSGPTVEILFASYEESRDTATWTTSEIGFKKRLDLIGDPYAFGVLEDNGELFAAVRMSPEKLGVPILALLTGDYSLELVCGLKSASFSSFITETEIFVDLSDRLVYRLSFSDPEFLDKMDLTKLTEGNEAPITLCCEGKPILRLNPYYRYGSVFPYGVANAPVYQPIPAYHIENNQLNFYLLHFNYGEKLSEENKFILELLDVVLNGDYKVSFFFEDYNFFPGQDGTTEKFGYHYDEDIDNINESMPSFVPDEIYTIGDDITPWRIYLDLPVNETLPATALEAVKTIYESIDFEAQPLMRSLQVILIDEDSSTSRERARIAFYKDFYNTTVDLSYIFEEGRLTPYQATFEELLAQSEFYSQFSR